MSGAAAVTPPDLAPRRAPEHALLLACARLHLPPAEAVRARKAAADVNWESLLALAERHRLTAFLHRHLRDAPLPPWAAAQLRERHRANVRAALFISAELRRLTDALAADGVESLAYKGPALAVQAYGDLSLRTYEDLDLLVRPADVPRALDVLGKEGYTPVLMLSTTQERYFRQVDGDYPLVHRDTGALVELHARVSSLRFGVPIETDALMRRAVPIALGGTEVRALAPEDLLLVLCVHGAKHRWRRLEWIASVAELLRGAQADVHAVLRAASALRARRTLLLGLALAHRLLDAPLAADVVREMDGDGGIGALADEAERRTFEGGADGGDEAPANLAFNLRARDGTLDRARYAAAWAFGPTPEDWKWARLPDALFPLYRVLRPVRLLLRHGRARP